MSIKIPTYFTGCTCKETGAFGIDIVATDWEGEFTDGWWVPASEIKEEEVDYYSEMVLNTVRRFLADRKFKEDVRKERETRKNATRRMRRAHARACRKARNKHWVDKINLAFSGS